MTLEGVLPVWKPVDFTSHDVVAKVRRITRIKRIGHTGTLDPKVTGVLPLCIGRATRMVEYIQELPKSYEAVMFIGYATDTEDLTGSVIEEAESVSLTEEQIREAVLSFSGVIEQVPPMYSAVRVDGKRLYDLARQGVEVERKSRTVQVYDIRVISISFDSAYPSVRFHVTCSKGTYIRTLCADIGRRLGLPAVMGELVRTSTGSLTPENCLTLERIEELQNEGRLQEYMIPADQAVSHFPSYRASETEARFALTGRSVRLRKPLQFHAAPGVSQLVRVYGPTDEFLGLFRYDSAELALQPEKVFG